MDCVVIVVDAEGNLIESATVPVRQSSYAPGLRIMTGPFNDHERTILSVTIRAGLELGWTSANGERLYAPPIVFIVASEGR